MISGLRAEAVGDVPAVNARQQILHVRVVEAQHRQAVKRHFLDELDEGVLQDLVRLVEIEVLGVDVGDDRDRGREAQERAVALVGLGDQQVAFAEARVAAERGHAPADHHRRVEACRAQNRGHERSGGGLAVRAGDGDAVLHAHQLGEHLGPRNHRDPVQARLANLRVFVVDRARVHDHVRPVHVLGTVPDVDPHAEAFQILGVLAGPQIGTGHVELQRAQDLGEPAHADAADTDEVHVTNATAKHQTASRNDWLNDWERESGGSLSPTRAEL